MELGERRAGSAGASSSCPSEVLFSSSVGSTKMSAKSCKHYSHWSLKKSKSGSNQTKRKGKDGVWTVKKMRWWLTVKRLQNRWKGACVLPREFIPKQTLTFACSGNCFLNACSSSSSSLRAVLEFLLRYLYKLLSCSAFSWAMRSCSSHSWMIS